MIVSPDILAVKCKLRASAPQEKGSRDFSARRVRRVSTHVCDTGIVSMGSVHISISEKEQYAPLHGP